MSTSPPPPPAAARRKSSAFAAGGALSWQQVQVAIVALGEPASSEALEPLVALLERFVGENEDPRTSPHLRATAPDRLEPLVALLARADVARGAPAARVLALKALKILARRGDLRQRCTQAVLEAVAPLLDAGAGGSGGRAPQPAAAQLASEAANALSNLCYEPANASGLLRANGAPRLLKLLSVDAAGADAHANAAGALQTLSFQPEGRAALIKAGGAATVLQRLESTRARASGVAGTAAAAAVAEADARLQQRLVGALHNLSSGAEGTAAIRQHGGIPPIVDLLALGAHPGVAASAAGALQNMSRERAAAADIRAHPRAVGCLVELLAAVCAAGTLANLCCGAAAPEAERAALTAALGGALAGGAVLHSLGAGQMSPAAAAVAGSAAT
ncbi:ARM repeat-containing [Micractinium conductrix]|uniref:Vacuolar protein 8 n=1 Tax=Micractinium conductrix TaxID=554055 RepID=A0A2P6VQC6_9CHLO|nr:ARM repeat-containing [Micractinium conductrix]|eukprot:PSC76289.1 ARM repeat-containing [Micractinium conductrix]